MTKRAILLVATMVLTMLFASGVALAITEVGGPGNDTLIGTNAADRLYGRAGNDAISGLAGSDPRLVGGSGDDSVVGGPGDDVIFGPGVKGGVIEGAEWGEPTDEKGSDTLSGNAGDDYLAGGFGSDRLHAGGGRDFLLDALGDAGMDRSVDVLSGGAGNDQLIAWSGEGPKDLLRCGDGTDRVVADKGIDRVSQDCEIVFWSPGG